MATTEDLSAALKQTNKNPLLPPYYTITRKLIFQLDYVLSNASYLLQSQQSPIFKPPMLPTPKHVAETPRVSPPTTQDFHNIYPTTQNNRRDICVSKYKNSPKPPPLPYP